MRIKKRLRINAVASLLIAFVIGFVLALALYQLNKANNSAIVAGNIIASSFERVSLRNDYIRSNSERAKDQWFDKEIQINKLLKSTPEYFEKSEDKKKIRRMIESQESQNEIFSALVANREKNYLNAGLTGLSLEVEERLLNQLNIRVYEVVLQSRALQESSREARDSALKLAEGGVASALLVIIAAALINLWSMGRVITDRVNRLRNGAVVIGGGDLAHLIDIKGDDEFAELSEAFNAMTVKLSGSYHDLEVEIEERKRIEEERAHLSLELQSQSAELDATLSSMVNGLIVYDMAGKAIRLNDTAKKLLPAELFFNTTVEERLQVLSWETESGQPFPLEEIPVARALRGETSINVVLATPFLDRKLWILSSAAPILTPDGKMHGAVATFIDITANKQADEALKASLAEKEVMLKEIHHRVKNNLQVISSLVSLQSDNLTDERMRDELNDVRDRVRSMAMIHEKLYQSSDLAQLNFADYAASLLRSLWRSHGALAEKVRLNLELAPVKLSIEAAVPCGLILNELAGNALKHAYPDGSGGEVTVGLEHDTATDAVCLRVHDNGVGLPAGLDWQQSKSLGLRLVRILAGQLSGTVETKTGTGTEFRVTFYLKGFQA